MHHSGRCIKNIQRLKPALRWRIRKERGTDSKYLWQGNIRDDVYLSAALYHSYPG